MERRHNIVLTGLLAALGPAAVTPAALITYFEDNGGGGNPRGFYDFDTATGISTLRSTVAAGPRFFSLAQRPSDGMMFAIDPQASEIFTVDLDTGSFMLVAGTGLDTIGDITFDPVTGQMYGLGRNSSLMYEIDETDGSSTLVGTAASVRTALAFDPSGDLFGMSLDPEQLFTVDPSNADTMFVGDSGLDALIEDATFTAASEMFITDFFGSLYEIDTTDGSSTFLGTTGMGSGLLGVVAVPTPGALAVVMLAGLTRGRRRRA